ncbi:MAG: hypothetical protein AMR96_00305 [Candidatus Adiutrix intracellularis]|jgi:TPR repeat protein|nr:MAG: hypothetical protein AMR96_00305 [Candidatus Adiutrix intracellularis]MDR2826944.1 SEL1-like repeat protein [Candidatus Adiutrix intracellularis]
MIKRVPAVAIATLLTLSVFSDNLILYAIDESTIGTVTSDRNQILDSNETFEVVLKKAEAGDVEAMYQVGRLYETAGRGAPRNFSTAVVWYRKAAEAGRPEGFLQLGLSYEIGKGVTADRGKALEYLRQAALMDLKEAVYALVTLTLAGTGPSSADLQTARKYLIELGKEAEPQTFMTLGAFYENGIGIAPNYTEALFWYQKAAATNLPEAFYSLGVCYEVGLGAAAEPAKAILNFQKAADLKIPNAAYKLAFIYLEGFLVDIDQDKAISYLKEALENGQAEAGNELGVIYLQGRLNQPHNQAKALEMFIKSAELGNPEAMKNVAVIFRNGLGTEPDLAVALKWYLIARDSGYQGGDFNELLAEVKQKLSSRVIQNSEDEAAAWMAAFRPKN